MIPYDQKDKNEVCSECSGKAFGLLIKGMAWLNTATSPSSCLDYRCDALSRGSHFGPMKAMLNRITETTCPGIIKLLSQCHHLPTFNFLLFEKHKTLFVETKSGFLLLVVEDISNCYVLLEVEWNAGEPWVRREGF